MSHISPLEKYSNDGSKSTIQKVKKKRYEDHDPIVLICMVKLLQHKNLFKYFQIVVVGLHIFGFIYSTQGKFRKLYNGQLDNAIVKFVDCLSSGMLAATNIFSIIHFARNTAVYNLIFDVPKNNSNITGIYEGRFKQCMIILHVLTFLLLLILFCFFTFKIGWSVYQYILPRDFEFYCFNLLAYAVLCMVHKINEIFQDVNQSLLEIDREFMVPYSHTLLDSSDSTTISTQRKTNYLERLKSITQYHNNICNLLDKFNDYFKTVLVLMVLSMILDLLWDCTILIELTFKPELTRDINTSVLAICIYPLLMFITIGQAALTALVGENLASEGQKTTVLCCSLLNKLPAHLQTETDQLIEKQISLLLNQSRLRNVSLHAGGFFKLDWSILGSITSTVTTYSIVIIQFLLK